MAKHTPDPTLRRRPNAGAGILLAVLLILVAGVSVFFLSRGDGSDEPVADPAPAGDAVAGPTATDAPADVSAVTSDEPQDCSPVAVWAAPEVLAAVTSAADRAATDCFRYDVTDSETATALTSLRGDERPDVWIPNSTAWPGLAANEGVELQFGEALASTPVMLVTARETVEVLGEQGIRGSSTFAEITQSYRQLTKSGDAPFTLRVGDPRVDAATMALLVSTMEQPGGWAEDSSESREILVRLAQTATQGDPLATVVSDPTTVVPATEQQLAAAEAQEGQLQGIPLADGGGEVRVPFVTLASTGSAAAVETLEQELRSPEAASDFTELGLRPGTDGEPPIIAGVPDGLSVGEDAPSTEAVARTAEIWTAVAPESRILTVVDISGSMEAEIEDTTRIDLTRTAVQTAIAAIPEQTTMGLWYFATALDGELDYEEQVPLRPLATEVEAGSTQKEVLLQITADLGVDTLTGDTGLHDSLWAAYESMRSQQTPDSISSVLLLTDGINDDSTGGLSEDAVVALLADARESSDVPVNVVLIGMGPDVDEEALERLAEAAGGESLILRDPLELPQVFVDVVADRAP